MRKSLFICSLVIIFSGCATIYSIERNARNINPSDGISRQEAKIIAQKQIIENSFKKDYRITNPKVYDISEFNDEAIKKESFITDVMSNKELYNNGEFRYSDSWYVVFHPKSLSFFTTYYLVIVDKKSGQVQYSYEKNAIAALSPLVSWAMQEHISQLHIAAISATYYSEKNHWPSDGQELQEYFETKMTGRDHKEDSKINFEDFQFEQTPKGHLLISKKEEEEKEVIPLYEILPLTNSEFVVNCKEDISQLDYVLKINGDKITVNPYFKFKDDKRNNAFLETLATFLINFPGN